MMTEFVVGKKYIGRLHLYTCLFVHEDGVVLQRTGGKPSWLGIKDATRALSLYSPPPKKVKKTGWIVFINDYDFSTSQPDLERSCRQYIYKTEADARKNWIQDGSYKFVEITWEEEVPGDEDDAI